MGVGCIVYAHIQDLCFYQQAFEELEDLLAENNICIAIKEKLVKDSGVAEETAYDSIVQRLLTKPRARGNFTLFFDKKITLFLINLNIFFLFLL